MSDYTSPTQRPPRRRDQTQVGLFIGIGAVVFLGIAALIVMALKSPPPSLDASKPRAAAAAPKPVPKGKRVAAEDLFGQYQGGAAKADAAYKGKSLIVEGVVDVFAVSDNDEPYLLLRAHQWQPGVRCVFDSKQRSQLAPLRPGDRVSVQGQCTGFPEADGPRTVQMVRCQIVSHSKAK